MKGTLLRFVDQGMSFSSSFSSPHSKWALGSLAFTCANALGAVAFSASPRIHSILPLFGRDEMALSFGMFAVLGALVGFVTFLRAPARDHAAWLGALSVLATIWGGIGAVMMHVSVYDPSYAHGRRLRRRTRLLVTPTARGDEWLAAESIDVPAEIREGVAAEWRSNGCKEHASIAAFSRLALQLVAVGAPPELVANAHRDAVDEVRHARICFSIATALDGREEGPAPFPEAAKPDALLPTRVLSLAQIAVESFVDGVLNEGIAARLLAQLARLSADERLGDLMRAMAADESRHAQHSWEIVEFCIATGGERVKAALRGALRAVPNAMTSPLPEAARDGAWEAFGVQGVAMEKAEWEKARARAEMKLRAMIEIVPAAA